MTGLFWTLLCLALIAATVDVLSTAKGLAMGLTELNPAARWIFNRLGVIGGGVVMKVPQFALLLYIAHRAPGSWVAVAGAAIVLAVSSYAAVSNLKAIEKRETGQ